MFTGNEVIEAVEKCPMGVCKGKYTIVISSHPTAFKNEQGEAYHMAEGRIGGTPFSHEMVPESRIDIYRQENLDWLKVKMFKNARINLEDIQVGYATPQC